MPAPTRPAALSGATEPPAHIAKAALRRLAQERLEPTPENFARAYLQESGEPPAASAAPVAPQTPPVAVVDGPALAALIDKIVRGIERGGRQWTMARRKDGLRRVLEGSRSDAARLQQRLTQLVGSWESDTADASADTAFGEPDAEPGPTARTAAGANEAEAGGAPRADDATVATPASTMARGAVTDLTVTDGAATEAAAANASWVRIALPLTSTVGAALPSPADATQGLSDESRRLGERLQAEGATPALIAEVEAFCERAAPVLRHRHHFVEQLGGLCLELTSSLTDLAENDSWAQGQCAAMRLKIEDGLSARGVRAVSELLRDTRERQGRVRVERENARDALKGLIHQMLSELDQLGSQTGQFHDHIGRYADVIEQADTLEGLAGAVRELVEESRTVQTLVDQTRQRLHTEHARASALTQRVGELEAEMRRLSDEVSTDQLTQIANRRGLLQAFDIERAQLARDPQPLCVGLLDIDNFKRLNDQLGHGAGDEALKALAARVSNTLRPTDRVARYGGEEFVVLLPATPLDDGQQILTRLQRSLTGGLFMHEQQQIFVTFSAGLTVYRPDERLEDALERADQALYEAKRTGKNRTCVA